MHPFAKLGKDERHKACVAFLSVMREPDYAQLREYIIQVLAKIKRFRPKIILQMPDEQLATLLQLYIHRPELRYLMPPVMQEWLRKERGEMLEEFFDRLGIIHVNHHIESAPETMEQGSIVKVLSEIRNRFSQRDVSIMVAILEREEALPFRQSLPLALEQVYRDEDNRSEPEQHDVEGVHIDESLPEDAEGITTLDRVLIMEMVATAFGQAGALNRDEILDLVEEVVDLNAARVRSVFHRGFMQSIFGLELSFEFGGVNELRKIWYLCGVLFGFIRQQKWMDCLAILEVQKELVDRMIENATLPCAQMLLPHIHNILRDNNRIELLCNWVLSRAAGLDTHQRMNLIMKLHNDAAIFYDRGMVVESRQLLDAVSELLDREKEPPDEALRDIRLRNERKLAQVHQRNRDFNAAEEILLRLSRENSFEDQPNVLSDLALIHGGFTSLLDILPTQNEDSRGLIHDALANGLEYLLNAEKRYGERAVNAHLCLGMYYFLQPENGERLDPIPHFIKARTGMVKNRQAYSEGNLIEWTKFCTGVAIIESFDEHRYQLAHQELNEAMNCNIAFPIWLWMRALKAAYIYPNRQMFVQILEFLNRILGERIFDQIRQAEIVPHQGEMRVKYIEWLRQSHLSVKERWAELLRLHSSIVQQHDKAQLATILDDMEVLAVNYADLRYEYLDLLNDTNNYSLVWDENDADFSRIRIHEIKGDYIQCGAVIRYRIYPLLEMADDYSILQAQGLWEHLNKILQVMPEDEHIANRLVNNGAIGEIDPAEINLTVLYIGGNEIQMHYENELRAVLEGEFTNVRFHFIFPGWDGNWMAWFEKIRPLMENADAIVLSRMVRTQLGRAIRAACNAEHPWYPCTGHGRDSIRRSIEFAINRRINMLVPH